MGKIIITNKDTIIKDIIPDTDKNVSKIVIIVYSKDMFTYEEVEKLLKVKTPVEFIQADDEIEMAFKLGTVVASKKTDDDIIIETQSKTKFSASVTNIVKRYIEPSTEVKSGVKTPRRKRAAVTGKSNAEVKESVQPPDAPTTKAKPVKQPETDVSASEESKLSQKPIAKGKTANKKQLDSKINTATPKVSETAENIGPQKNNNPFNKAGVEDKEPPSEKWLQKQKQKVIERGKGMISVYIPVSEVGYAGDEDDFYNIIITAFMETDTLDAFKKELKDHFDSKLINKIVEFATPKYAVIKTLTHI